MDLDLTKLTSSGRGSIPERSGLGNGAAIDEAVLVETDWFVDLRTPLLVCQLQQAREIVYAGGIGVTH